jgi:hypothetical protein
MRSPSWTEGWDGAGAQGGVLVRDAALSGDLAEPARASADAVALADALPALPAPAPQEAVPKGHCSFLSFLSQIKNKIS